MLWEVEIRPAGGQVDREGARALTECGTLGAASIQSVRAARSFLLQGPLSAAQVQQAAAQLLADTVVEEFHVRELGPVQANGDHGQLLNVLYKPGVTDNVAGSTKAALLDQGLPVEAVATCRKYWVNSDAAAADVAQFSDRILANDAIEHVLRGPLALDSLSLGSTYRFELKTVLLRELDDAGLQRLSKKGQLYLNLTEMQTIQAHFRELGRDPTDAELETVAQTWSEHCSHKTLAGRVRYTDERQTLQFENMLKETIFAATQEIRRRLGPDDWCVSVFRDNAGVVKFDEQFDVCIKVETHNHPSALEPYGGANTGLGGVIRDPLGTGLGAKPICNTDVFCFAPPDTPYDSLPPGVLHPKAVARGVVSGVRDYGNRMGIPTVNGAIFFDERYLGNPLVYCGNVALIPVGKTEKAVRTGDLIVAVGGRTGRDGIHGATFSSAELTQESETLSGGAVQIGNAITEKMLMDVILAARDKGLYSAITDCGAGGFSSAVGEMGAESGAEVWLDRAPLKYAGLSYTEIWISEAQERMVLSVPPANWEEFRELCAAEGVEATAIGEFRDHGRLILKYEDQIVADVAMSFLHDGRPPVIREATYLPAKAGFQNVRTPPRKASFEATGPTPASAAQSLQQQALPWLEAAGYSERETFAVRLALEEGLRGAIPRVDANRSFILCCTIAGVEVAVTTKTHFNDDLLKILGSLNVCSKEWVIRQYDHEVQGGSVVKPLVGVANDGPSDAAVVRPVLGSNRGLVVACGMNPRLGDIDPYWMAAAAIDEAVRNCVAVGADPRRIAILDNFCWGNTDRPETLGSLVRAALACRDVAIAYGTPFVSGKDSLNNEFSYFNEQNEKQTVAIPPSLLITALGQMADVRQAVTMDLKESGNRLFLVGLTGYELGGSHYNLVNGLPDGPLPEVNLERAPQIFATVHQLISSGLVRSCHDLSEGGLAVAVAEMAFAGGLGAELHVGEHARRSNLLPEALLFGETSTRFVVEIRPEHLDGLQAFEDLFEIGTVTDTGRLQIHGYPGEMLVDLSCAELKAAWQKPLAWDEA